MVSQWSRQRSIFKSEKPALEDVEQAANKRCDAQPSLCVGNGGGHIGVRTRARRGSSNFLT